MFHHFVERGQNSRAPRMACTTDATGEEVFLGALAPQNPPKHPEKTPVVVLATGPEEKPWAY